MGDRSPLLQYLFMYDTQTIASLLLLLSFFIFSIRHRVTRNPAVVIYSAQYAILLKYFSFIWHPKKIHKYENITTVEKSS